VLRPGRHAEARRRAIALVGAELERLRMLGPAGVRALAGGRAFEAEHGGISLCTRVDAERERLLVLVEARGGRRMLATGGFVMAPDGTTYTPE
jgi:hypothetical protein